MCESLQSSLATDSPVEQQGDWPRLSQPSSLIADGSRRSLQINDVVTFRPVESQLTPDLCKLHRNRTAAWSGTLQPSDLAMPMCHVDMNGDQPLHRTFHVHIPRNGRRRFVCASSPMESPLLCPDTGTTAPSLARYDCCDVWLFEGSVVPRVASCGGNRGA
jgi:hypothetical protein